MFVWLDLRSLLPKDVSGEDRNAVRSTIESTTRRNRIARGHRCSLPLRRAGWEAEQRLTDALFTRARILFTPGEACHAAEPGFYRCCFAWMPAPAVVEGFNRLAAYAAGAAAKTVTQQWPDEPRAVGPSEGS
jgi:bifunctional pyridoxal-dependent enzyme with beta-cystathionase and maltose regulon repressor activities